MASVREYSYKQRQKERREERKKDGIRQVWTGGNGNQ